MRERFTIGQIEAALRKTAGIYAAAAELLGADRSLVRKRVIRSSRLQAVCAELKESLGDMTQGKIIGLLNAGDPPTVRWYADRQMKDRGYGASGELAFNPEQIMAIVAAFGGNTEGLLALRARLADDGPEDPGGADQGD